MPAVVAVAFTFALGAAWGSFFNVCIHRLPWGLSIVHPPSRCPRCFAGIAPWDNIPILSYLLLLGRCRRCKMGIAWRYPLVEALTGAAFAALYLRHGLAWPLFYHAAFFGLLAVLGWIDAEHYILPDSLTLGGSAVGLFGAAFVPEHSFLRALAGGALGAGIMLAAYWGYYLWRRTEGLGLGDVKMMFMVGTFLGPKGVLATVLLASLSGLLIALWLAARGRAGWKTALPYGTFLAIGAAAYLFWGTALETWYWRMGTAAAERLM